MPKDSDETSNDKLTDEEDRRKAAQDRRANPTDRRGADRVSTTTERRQDQDRRDSD